MRCRILCVERVWLGLVAPEFHFLNLLHRLIDRKPTDHPEVDPPDVLALQTTPEANVDRYDGLRLAGEKRHAS